MPPRPRSTRVSFRQALVERVNESYGAQFQQVLAAWVAYQHVTLEADLATIVDEEGAIDPGDEAEVSFDVETGIPDDDLAVIHPDDDCVTEHFNPIDTHVAEMELQATTNQYFVGMLDRIRNLWQEHLQAISQSRYLQSFYRPPAPSTSDLVARLRYYEKWDLRRWHHWMRMPPYCFDDMLRSIEHNPVFHNNSSRPQMEVERQLAIWIIQAGRYGPGACSIEIAEWTGVSIGTVYNCSRRCMIALMSCHDDAFAPDETQRPGAKKLAEEKSRTPEWGGGILAADGTPVKVFVRPGWYGSDFYGKDKIYAIQLTLIIWVHTLLILDYAVGQPGSVHDATAFKETFTWAHHDQLLHPYEWIWADSAYPLLPWLITPFKAPRGERLTARQRTFNYRLSKIRVAAEHAIGLLKIRWQSLKELRIYITSEVKLAYAVMWIRTCLIMHNMVIKSELAHGHDIREHNTWNQEMEDLGVHVSEHVDRDDDDIGQEAEEGAEHPEGTDAGKAKREQLLEQLLRSLEQQQYTY